MRVLITSGGTKIPIDPVRYIGNDSSGTLGSQICKAFVDEDWDVTFVRAKGSKALPASSCAVIDEHIFVTFDDYYKILETLLITRHYDAVVLVAAVSDYGVVYNPKKIRTADELTLKMYPLPKVISLVRGWQPTTFLVGFKLLKNEDTPVPVEDLITASLASIKANDCDLVVANDGSNLSIQYHVRPDGTVKTITSTPMYPGLRAEAVVEAVSCGRFS